MVEYLLNRFGPRLPVPELAEVLRLKPQSIYDQISAGTFPVKTYRIRSRRYADHRDVAEYLDGCREVAG